MKTETEPAGDESKPVLQRSEGRSLTETPGHGGDDGVDVTLIRWLLSMTPAERLDNLQQAVNSILALRAGIRECDRNDYQPPFHGTS